MSSVLIVEALRTNGVTACEGFPAIVFSLFPVIVVVVAVFVSLETQHLMVAAMEAAMFSKGDLRCSLIHTPQSKIFKRVLVSTKGREVLWET